MLHYFSLQTQFLTGIFIYTKLSRLHQFLQLTCLDIPLTLMIKHSERLDHIIMGWPLMGVLLHIAYELIMLQIITIIF